jgi:hypothetical protein
VFGAEVSIGFTVELLELAEFFFESHPGEECVDSLFDILTMGGWKKE